MIFAAAGERIELTHKASSRETFAAIRENVTKGLSERDKAFGDYRTKG